jgi:serine/threonine protein kinase
MLPVAPTDLSTLLHEVDDMVEAPTRNKYQKWIQRYPGCLIRAMDYIHEMRVKHKDIKPSNLLVDGNKIYITDFGISKDMANAGTTGTMEPLGLILQCTVRQRPPIVRRDVEVLQISSPWVVLFLN